LLEKSELPILPLDYVSQAVYPDLGEFGYTVPVPPPTVTGYQAYSTTYGSIYGNTHGNSFSGNYSGTTSTTLTPTYDYSAQMSATMQNLGVAIRNERIQNQNAARDLFHSNRMGDLELGKLEGGSARNGYIFFRTSASSKGPYEVIINANGKDIPILFEFKKE